MELLLLRAVRCGTLTFDDMAVGVWSRGNQLICLSVGINIVVVYCHGAEPCHAESSLELAVDDDQRVGSAFRRSTGSGRLRRHPLGTWWCSVRSGRVLIFSFAFASEICVSL